MGVLVALVVAGGAALIFVARRRSGRKSKIAAMGAGAGWPSNEHQGYMQAPSNNQTDVHLGQMGPPGYGHMPAESYTGAGRPNY